MIQADVEDFEDFGECLFKSASGVYTLYRSSMMIAAPAADASWVRCLEHFRTAPE
jgi:hypothetical protein